MSRSVRIELTPDQALVLFEWIGRYNKREDEPFDHQAEERVLWDVEAMLENLLPGPFRSDYESQLAAARARVRDPAR